MSITNPRTKEQVTEDILNNMAAAGKEISRASGSVAYDLTGAQGIEISEYENDLTTNFERGFLLTSKGNDIDLNAEEYGTFRDQGKASTGDITITIPQGNTISAGTKVFASSTPDVTYSTTVAASGDPSGQTIVPVQCDQLGTIGNAISGSIDSFVTTPPGATAVTNINTFIDGKDVETDQELIERAEEKRKFPGSSGNVYHYKEWVSDIENTGRTRVYPRWDSNPYTVKVLFLNSSQQEADAPLIAEVDEYIREEAPTGAILTIDTGTEVLINVDVDIISDSSYSNAEVTANINAELVKYFAELAFNDEKRINSIDQVSWSGTAAATQHAEGVIDISNLLINGGTTNVVLTDEEFPELGVLNVNFI